MGWTRREVLRDALAIPLAASGLSVPAGPRILAAPDCLSQESAEGFRPVLAGLRARNVIVLCGMSCVDLFRLEAFRGAWIICEPSPFTINGARDSESELYVRYRWPHIALTRCFSRAMPVSCQEAEAIAHYRGVPVAMKRRIGCGGMIWLGSMLGPNLRAEEPQARALAAAIFSEIACGGTSKAASTNT